MPTANDSASKTIVHPTTPLRERGFSEREGCLLASDLRIDYVDGSEDRVASIVSEASDVSSMSDELESLATERSDLYHVIKSRSNVLRALDLRREYRVLEIGAGCGAVTRYLGESCSLVDAVEPMFGRARVARLRTRDLAHVNVYVGGLEDVPAEPAYDAIVFCGVLEYMGGGAAQFDPYVDVLRRARKMLLPGGFVICAIENKLGAKYLAGAAEDHTSRRFDGVEGYPYGSKARTFTRSELTTIFTSAGLDPEFLHAFPDYKATRMVYSDSLTKRREAQHLLWSIPTFPSHDWWSSDKWTFADERRLWKTLVESGYSSEFANSFVVTATSADDVESGRSCWPENRLCTYFNVEGRKSRFGISIEVAAQDGNIAFHRTRIDDSQPPSSGLLELRLVDDDLVVGEDLVEVISRGDKAEIRAYLQEWTEILLGVIDERESGDLSIPIDLVPHNLVVDTTGKLRAIDQEWWWTGECSVDDVVARGLLCLAERVAYRGNPSLWKAVTVGELFFEFARLIDIAPTEDWKLRCIAFEASIHANLPFVTDSDIGLDQRIQQHFLDLLDRPLTQCTHSRAQDVVDLMRDDGGGSPMQALQGANETLSADLHAVSIENERRANRIRDLEESERMLLQHQTTILTSRGWRILERARRIVRGKLK